MVPHSNAPRSYDAVLGGKTAVKTNILISIQFHCLQSNNSVTRQKAALKLLKLTAEKIEKINKNSPVIAAAITTFAEEFNSVNHPYIRLKELEHNLEKLALALDRKKVRQDCQKWRKKILKEVESRDRDVGERKAGCENLYQKLQNVITEIRAVNSTFYEQSLGDVQFDTVPNITAENDSYIAILNNYQQGISQKLTTLTLWLSELHKINSLKARIDKIMKKIRNINEDFYHRNLSEISLDSIPQINLENEEAVTIFNNYQQAISQKLSTFNFWLTQLNQIYNLKASIDETLKEIRSINQTFYQQNLAWVDFESIISQVSLENDPVLQNCKESLSQKLSILKSLPNELNKISEQKKMLEQKLQKIMVINIIPYQAIIHNIDLDKVPKFYLDRVNDLKLSEQYKVQAASQLKKELEKFYDYDSRISKLKTRQDALISEIKKIKNKISKCEQTEDKYRNNISKLANVTDINPLQAIGSGIVLGMIVYVVGYPILLILFAIISAILEVNQDYAKNLLHLIHNVVSNIPFYGGFLWALYILAKGADKNNYEQLLSEERAEKEKLKTRLRELEKQQAEDSRSIHNILTIEKNSILKLLSL